MYKETGITHVALHRCPNIIYDEIGGLIADGDRGMGNHNKFRESRFSLKHGPLLPQHLDPSRIEFCHWPSPKSTASEHTVLKRFIMCVNDKSKKAP